MVIELPAARLQGIETPVKRLPDMRYKNIVLPVRLGSEPVELSVRTIWVISDVVAIVKDPLNAISLQFSEFTKY